MPPAGNRISRYNILNVDSRGSNGFYWSSTSNDSSKADFLSFKSNNINHISPYDRFYGFPVRCLMNNIDAVILTLNPNSGNVENSIIAADTQ